MLKTSIVFLCVITVAAAISFIQGIRWPEMFKRDPDEYISTLDLIRNKGYVAEQHEAITRDGYKLILHRIPYGRYNSELANRPVALLQHGLLDVDSSWVANFPDQSLGFILADAGYDVWLGNVRGNTYGRGHETLNTSDTAFWDFSWSEMAEHDLPAMINLALKVTNQTSLFYVGHSQGTLMGFSKFEDKELQSKVKLFLALGPVATVKHILSPIKYIADLGIQSTQRVWYQLFGYKDFLPSDSIVEWLADKMCNIVVTDHLICKNIIFVFAGPSQHYNVSRTSVYTTHTPAGTSVKNLAHFSQMVISGKHQKYDYGSAAANYKHYKQTTPPLYNVSDVHVPVALYWADNDWLADPLDVDYLRSNLPHIVEDYCVEDWDHLDFTWGINGREAMYDRMISLMNSFV